MANSKPDIRQFKQLSEKFSLIPLNGKAPIERDWTKWCSKKRAFKQNEFKNNNAGIACGKASGVLVLDMDNEKKFKKLLKDNNYSMPETYQVKTGRADGIHYYFSYPQDGKVYGNRSFKKYGFDIKAHGGQVVAPGSIHPDTGKVYHVINDVPIAEPPEFLLKLAAKEDIKIQPQDNKLPDLEVDSLSIKQDTKDLIMVGKSVGDRSESMMTVLDALAGAGLSDEEIIAIFDNHPIGDKYREKGSSKDNWIMSQIQKARSYVSTQEPSCPNPQETTKNNSLVLAKPESVKDFLDREIPERKPLIQDLLNIEEFHIASGAAKQGKTILGMNMAMSLASGEEFLGHKIHKPHICLYIQQEVSQYFFKERLEIMIAEYINGRKNAIKIKQLIFNNFFHWSNRGLHIDDEKQLLHIMEWIDDLKPSVVFFDPLYLLHRKDENKANEMARLMEIFHSLISQYSTSIFLIHHAGKNNDYSGGNLHRGSSVLSGASDGNWILQKKGKSENLNLSLELRNQKEVDDITLNRESDSLWLDVVSKESLVSRTVTRIKETVGIHGEIAQKDLLLQLKKEGVGQRTFYNAIKMAKKTNAVNHKKDGNKIILCK
jgi:hypothetical protein|tara:strand:+ start:518 stop:2320 length:1803 start_codon:yes stop_codon:yes gene_type:complete